MTFSQLSVLLAIDLAWPAVLLPLLRRRTGRWRPALAGTAVLAPLAAALLTGGLVWLAAYVRVAVRGDAAMPAQLGVSVSHYLWLTFATFAGLGALAAGAGLGLWLAVVSGWRLAHPASFRRAFPVGPGCPASAAEQDYNDAAAEPVGAPDRGGGK